MFVRTIEAGTITGAADALGVDKSIVSRRIKALEDRLGTKLLNRSTRRLSLTEPGRAYFERAKGLLTDWREMEDDVRGDDAALSGSIRLAAPLSFGLSQLSPVLIDFQANHPEIRLDVDFSDRRVDLAAEGFDLAIRIGRLDDSALIARKLGRVEMAVVASPSWLAETGPITSLEALQGQPSLAYALRDSRTWSLTTPDGERQSLSLSPVMRASNGDFLRDAASEGLGVTIQPDFIVCDAIRAGSLVQILPDHAFEALSVYAVWLPTRYMPKRTRALIDLLADRFGGTPPWSVRPA